MRPAKMCGIAAVFGIFQALMPLAGWTCVHTVVKIFNSFQQHSTMDSAYSSWIYRSKDAA